MSLLSQLQSFPGSRHKEKRLGRGKSSGHGGTSTKGHKGQRARSGFGLLRGFEGGQMPLVRLLPKFGFTNNRFKTKYVVLNLSDLKAFETEVNPTVLYEAGRAGKKSLIKILGEGKLNKPLKVKAHKFSKKAVEIIKKAGGQVEVLSLSAVNKSNIKTNVSPSDPIQAEQVSESKVKDSSETKETNNNKEGDS